MSEKDEEKPVIEVTEESWEDDTTQSDVSALVDVVDPLDAEPESLPNETADTRRPEQLAAASVEGSPMSGEVPTRVDSSSDRPDDVPLDEELSESLRPAPPPVPTERPSERPVPEAPVPTDSEPPPSSRPTGFSHPAVTQPSLSVAEQFLRARRIGTGIWYAGVFLWSYLIVGEYVIGAELPEFFGWSAFAGVVVGAFLHGANRIGTAAMRRVAPISAAAVIGSTLLLTTIVGSSRRSEYQSVSLLLLLVAVGLIFWGIRFSRGGLPKMPRRPGVNWPRLALWVAFVGNTALIATVFLSQA